MLALYLSTASMDVAARLSCGRNDTSMFAGALQAEARAAQGERPREPGRCVPGCACNGLLTHAAE